MSKVKNFVDIEKISIDLESVFVYSFRKLSHKYNIE